MKTKMTRAKQYRNKMQSFRSRLRSLRAASSSAGKFFPSPLTIQLNVLILLLSYRIYSWKPICEKACETNMRWMVCRCLKMSGTKLDHLFHSNHQTRNLTNDIIRTILTLETATKVAIYFSKYFVAVLPFCLGITSFLIVSTYNSRTFA